MARTEADTTKSLKEKLRIAESERDYLLDLVFKWIDSRLYDEQFEAAVKEHFCTKEPQ